MRRRLRPVLDLAALREFRGAETNALVRSLALLQHAEKLAGRAAWLIIGDRDERVGTEHAITFARRLTERSLARGLPGRVDLHVIVEPRGHTTPPAPPSNPPPGFAHSSNPIQPLKTNALIRQFPASAFA